MIDRNNPRYWPWWYRLLWLAIFVGGIIAILTCRGPGC